MSDAANIVGGTLTRGSFRLDVDLAWDDRVTVFFGRSGAGKSSLFELILGLHPRAASRVRLGGEWLADPAQETLPTVIHSWTACYASGSLWCATNSLVPGTPKLPASNC